MNFNEQIQEDDRLLDNYVNILSSNVPNNEEFRIITTYTIKNILHIFGDDFLESAYDIDSGNKKDRLSSLLLPCLKTMWSYLYSNTLNLNEEEYKLLQCLFDVNEFYNFLYNKFKETEFILSGFNNFEKNSKHLALIVEEYQGILYKEVKDTKCIKSKMRLCKINKSKINENL